MPAIDRLVSGYKKFMKEHYPEHRDLYRDLVERGQKPHTMVISCSDSRVDPSIIFQMNPGSLFVVRNIANLVPPYHPDNYHHGTSAALEFAVTVLKVEAILVLGHSHCGGVNALMQGCCGGHSPDGEFIAPWVSLAEKAWDYLPDELQKDAKESHGKPSQETLQALEMANVTLSLDNIQTFPFVKEAIAAGTLKLEGWHFDIASGGLLRLQPGSSAFSPLEETNAA